MGRRDKKKARSQDRARTGIVAYSDLFSGSD